MVMEEEFAMMWGFRSILEESLALIDEIYLFDEFKCILKLFRNLQDLTSEFLIQRRK